MNSKKEKEKKHWYLRYYKLFLIIPIVLLLLSIISISLTMSKDGTPIHRDVSLKGGLSAIIQIENQMSTNELKELLEKKFPNNDFSISELSSQGKKNGFVIDTDLNEEELRTTLETVFSIQLKESDNYSSNFISPTLSASFFKQTMYILVISLVLMSAVIFLYFKQLVPSCAVVISAIFDIIVTVGILDALGVKISIAGIGALLMIIGYSIDTDVLLTNRLIREKGENYLEKLTFAFKTGVLMSTTTLIAAIGALLLTNSEIIFQISLIMIIGLIVDFISTWLQNAGILFLWLEKQKKL
jgi:preprotein translocase subunit SecF